MSRERALERGPVGGRAVRREHVLDRTFEQRSQRFRRLLPGDVVAEPLRRDLEAATTAR